MKNFVFLVCTVFWSSSIIAGSGTMVGNGGGFAEMQALHIDSLLIKYIERHPQFSDFAESLRKNPQPALGFDHNCYVPDSNYIEHNPHKLPSCLLYSTDEEESPWGLNPLSLDEIGATVFAIRWMNLYEQGSWEQLYSDGLMVFSQSKFINKKTPLTWKSQLVAVLHSWTLHDPSLSRQEAQATLELPRQSIDVLEKIKMATSCHSSFSFEVGFLSIQRLSSEGFWAHGPLNWTCGDQRFHGQTHLKVMFGLGVDTPSLEAIVTGKRPQ